MTRSSARLGLRLGLCLTVMLVAPTAWSESAPATAQNLARNPSFELDENKDGVPDDWEPFDLCTPYRTTRCSHDAQAAHAGRRSAMIMQGDLYLAITGTMGWLQRGIVDQGGGKTFRVSAYVRAGEPEKNNPYVKTFFPTRVRLYLFGEDSKRGPDYTGAASPVFDIGPEWRRIVHTVTFARDITKVSLILAREAQIGGGHVWFDSVEVVEVGK